MFTGKIEKSEVVQTQDALPPGPAEKNVLFFENFEISPGRFTSTEADLAVDFQSASGRGHSLKIHNKSDSVSAGTRTDGWNLGSHPLIRFSYKIPPGTSIVIRVKTEFDDWMCLAGTLTAQCPDVSAKDLVSLADDGQWHDVSIDAKAAVHSLLAAVRDLKELQFFIPKARMDGEIFWIDNFRIVQP